jgi:hypothetical protein
MPITADDLLKTFWGGMLRDMWGAAKLPGDVYAGRVDPTSDEGIKKATGLAGMAMMGATAAPRGALGSGPVRMPKYGSREVSDDQVKSVRAALDEPKSRQFESYGLRADDAAYDADASTWLPPSRQWVDGEPTDELLSGTSSVGLPDSASDEEIRAAILSLKPYLGDNLYLLGSKSAKEAGEDEGEALLKKAVALAKWERAAALAAAGGGGAMMLPPGGGDAEAAYSDIMQRIAGSHDMFGMRR